MTAGNRGERGNKIARITEIPDGVDSVGEVLRMAGTDWDIESVPLMRDLGEDVAPGPIGHFTAPGYKALVRPDNHVALSFVSDRYRPNSHRQHLMALDGLVGSGRIVPSCVSAWDNGALQAYQFRCPELDVTVVDSDVVSPMLTLVFAYGFPLADTAFFSDFRWFCKNQLGRVGKLSEERANHRGNVSHKYAEILGNRLTELKGELADHYRTMRSLPEVGLGGRDLHAYFCRALGASPNETELCWLDRTPREDAVGLTAKVGEVLECYSVDDANAPGTVWHAYNAVTRYATHKNGRSAETRLRSNLLGEGTKVIQRAFSAAAELAA